MRYHALDRGPTGGDTLGTHRLRRAGDGTGRAVRPRRAAERLPLAPSARRARRRAPLHRRRSAGARRHRDRRPTRTCRSTANATMLAQFLDALGIDAGRPRRQRQRRRHRADLRGDPSRTRAQPDAHRLRRARQLAARGLQAVPRDGGRGRPARRARGDARRHAVFRSPEALGPAYEHPEQVTDETIETYLRPLVRTAAAHCATSSASSPRSTARIRRPSRPA